MYGAISEQLNKPLFSTGKGTTSDDFSKFLKKIRGAFPFNRGRKIYLVLDNAMAHHTTNVTNMAASQKIELMFLPPYTPELNPIEALWGIIKRDFKNRMANCKSVTLQQPEFAVLLQQCLEAVSPQVQQKAARTNHRAYMFQVLGEHLANNLLQPEPFVPAEIEVELHPSVADSGQLELGTDELQRLVPASPLLVYENSHGDIRDDSFPLIEEFKEAQSAPVEDRPRPVRS